MKIQKKFVLALLITFILTLLLVHTLLSQTLAQHQELTLTEQTTQLKQTSKRYVMQFRQLAISPHLLQTHATELTQNLSNMYLQHVALYTIEGKLLHEALPAKNKLLSQKSIAPNKELLALAKQNKAGFVIEEGFVQFAYPIYIYGELIGIIHFSQDYSATSAYYEQLKLSAMTVLTIIFILIFLIIFVLTRHISIPITALAKVATQIADGHYDTPLPAVTKDEIGDLTKAIHHMRATIHSEKQKQTRFFQHMTHELKTPITSISGYAQILGDASFHDPVFTKRAITAIHNDANHLHQLVKKLLYLTKLDLYTPQVTAINVLQIVNEFCPVKGQPIWINGNEDELRILFSNVIHNATTHGNNVVVTMTDVITIMNDTKPIPSRVLDNIFEPFVHNNTPTSNGLGLYIAKQITEAHQGHITFTYQEGRAIVTIDFSNKLAITET